VLAGAGPDFRPAPAGFSFQLESVMRATFTIAVAGLVLLLAGCASAPPGPRGPLLGPGIEVATDYSYAYGAGSVELPDGTRSSGSADNYWSALTILPRRLEGRLSPVKWLDIGGQLGWLDSGADLRVGVPAAPERSWAFDLAAGFDTGRGGLFEDTKPTRSRWLRLEAYPSLPNPQLHTRLVLAAGADFGTFLHQLGDPRPQTTFSDGWGPAAIQVVRTETRLEGSVGVFVYPGVVGSFMLTINPYVTVDSGAPETSCHACQPIASYAEDWGIVLVMRLALRVGF
jgi:hypothetical protein